MNLATLFTPAQSAGRFFLVGVLPTYCATVFLLVLVWAGAPGPVRFADAWTTIKDLGVGEALLITLMITTIAVVLHPMQLTLVRLLEGYHWPEWIAHKRRARHTKKLDTLAQQASPVPVGTIRTEQQIADWHRADRLRRSRYATPDRVRPTALGNRLAAAEYRAGHDYGLDAIVAWPRLYPLISERMRTIVDDRRDQLDIAARFAVLGVPIALATAALLHSSGWWLALTAIPFAAALLAYGAALNAAESYGTAIRTAFDLHRFDLLQALHLELPLTPEEEQRVTRQLCAHWAQGTPAPGTYQHP